MKCKHGLESDTCALCLGHKQSTPDDKGMKGRDNLVQKMRGSQPRNINVKAGKEFWQLRKAIQDKADDFHEGGKK